MDKRNDTDETSQDGNPPKKLKLRVKKTLSLDKSVEIGTVRQSFSHGRSRSVVVEKKKRRPSLLTRTEAKDTSLETAQTKTEEETKKTSVVSARTKTPSSETAQVRKTGLTESEAIARAKALETAEIERQKAELERRQRQALEEENAKTAEAAHISPVTEKAAPALEEDLPPESEKEERLFQEKEAKKETPSEKARGKRVEPKKPVERRFGFGPPRTEKTSPGEAPLPLTEDLLAPKGSRKASAPSGHAKKEGAERDIEAAKPLKGRGGDRLTSERRATKLSVTSVMEGGREERGRSLASLQRRRERQRARERKKTEGAQPREKISREVIIPEAITVQELASRMAERAIDVIKMLMKQGQMLKINDVLDTDTAHLIAEEMGHTVKRVSEADVEDILVREPDKEGDLVSRPPVVTIMGHVDHGKTSLLDVLRKTNVVAGESGGITQHIGAYQIERNGQKMTFIDTPGHAAFTEMRARGAKVTDIVILVVAADDGVMPQTREAIAHARAAEAPIIVAINKIDKPSASPDRIRQELLQEGIFVETLGGDVLDVEVSALKAINLEGLQDAILLQAELLELKANPQCAGEGIVLEACLDTGRGPVVTALVQRGHLQVGDIIISGFSWGRIRAMFDDKNHPVHCTSISQPVAILGSQSVPQAGDTIVSVQTETQAREITEYRKRRHQEVTSVATQRGSLEQMIVRLKTNVLKELPLVIKGDVQGSVEAVISALNDLATEEVAVHIIYSGVGGISESDVTLAQASGAVILGFNVRANKQAQEMARHNAVEIRYYSVIYALVDDIKNALSGMLAPKYKEISLGTAEVLQIYDISKVGKIAGCRVTEGVIQRGAKVRLVRDDVVLHEGNLATLRHFKDNVREVSAGQECGINLSSYQDMHPNDIIECFIEERIERKL